jgi:hypothetical protein
MVTWLYIEHIDLICCRCVPAVHGPTRVLRSIDTVRPDSQCGPNLCIHPVVTGATPVLYYSGEGGIRFSIQRLAVLTEIFRGFSQ